MSFKAKKNKNNAVYPFFNLSSYAKLKEYRNEKKWNYLRSYLGMKLRISFHFNWNLIFFHFVAICFLSHSIHSVFCFCIINFIRIEIINQRIAVTIGQCANCIEKGVKNAFADAFCNWFTYAPKQYSILSSNKRWESANHFIGIFPFHSFHIYIYKVICFFFTFQHSM